MTKLNLTNRILQGLVLLTATLFINITQAAGLLTPADGRYPVLEIRDHHVDVLIGAGCVREVQTAYVGMLSTASPSTSVARRRRARST